MLIKPLLFYAPILSNHLHVAKILDTINLNLKIIDTGMMEIISCLDS